MWYLVVWGKREREKHLGYAADFCQLCRKIRAFTIKRVRRAGHIYFIPVERGTFLENRQTCTTCQTTRQCHLGTYTRIASSFDGSIERLIRETFPAVEDVYAERIEFENQIASGAGTVDSKLRREALMEGFSLASPHFEHGSGLEGRRLLTRTLKPFDPTAEEIRECLQHFRRNGARIGTKLRTADVVNSLAEEAGKTKPDAYDY